MPEREAESGAAAYAQSWPAQLPDNFDARLAKLVRPFQRAFPWPVLIVAAICITAFGSATWLAVQGTIPMALGFAINTYALIVVSSALHEAVHQNMSGRIDTLGWLNGALGHIAGTGLLLAYPMFRCIHLTHHKNTNDPPMDPDFCLNARGHGERTVRLLLLIPHYVGFYVRQSAAERGRSMATLLDWVICMAVYSAPLILSLAGFATETLNLWVGPAVLAVALLSLIHWSLHLPYDSRERYYNARIVTSRKWFYGLLRWLYHDQHCHLVHHMFPRIPLHLQRTAFERIRPELETKGVHILEL